MLPTIALTATVERQPEFPASPTLVLHLTGGGPMMRFAGTAVNAFGHLPSGVRLDGDWLFIYLLAVPPHRGQAELFAYAEDLAVASEEGTLLVLVHARVP